jgi:hypothetical protein
VATKRTFVMILSLLFIGIKAKSQYDFIAKQLVTSGQVKAIKQNWEFKNTNQGGTYYSNLSSSEFPLTYVYDGNCGNFEIRGNVFALNKYFSDGLACDLDLRPEAYQFYKFDFGNKRYIALECINNGSGSATSFIFIHLFQINKDSVLYYPLWSRYGSIACLGDFNKDGVLDFLKIRNNEKQTGTDTFKAILMSLESTGVNFKDLPQSKEWYFKKVYTKKNKIRIKTIKPSH